MKVLVRLFLLAGAAAALSLLARAPLAERVARRIAPEVAALAVRVPHPRPAPPNATAQAATTTVTKEASVPSMVPLLPPAPAPAPFKPSPKASASAAPKRHVVTRKEVEDAIATRLSGAKAVLVRGDDGKPAGLRLSGVGRLAPFGVADGDVLVAANGMPLRNADEALAALGALKDAQVVTVTLRRGSGLYSVPLELADAP